MRLDAVQRRALKFALQDLGRDDEVYLFGSRLDDNRLGGDIDLLIYSQQSGFELARKITRNFFKNCEEKIDVLVINLIKMTREQALFVQGLNKIRLHHL